MWPSKAAFILHIWADWSESWLSALVFYEPWPFQRKNADDFLLNNVKHFQDFNLSREPQRGFVLPQLIWDHYHNRDFGCVAGDQLQIILHSHAVWSVPVLSVCGNPWVLIGDAELTVEIFVQIESLMVAQSYKIIQGKSFCNKTP